MIDGNGGGKGGRGRGERAGKQIMNDSKNRRTEKHLPGYYRRIILGSKKINCRKQLGRSYLQTTHINSQFFL